MIVCDTNIWYNLGSGKVDPKVFSGHDLACTFVSVHELATSKNLYKDFHSVKNAVKAIRDHARIFLFTNPVNYILGKRETHGGEKYWNELQRVLNIEELIIPTEEAKLLDAEHNKMNASYYSAVDEMNKIAVSVKKNIRKNNLNKIRRKEDTTLITKKLLLGFINSYTNIETEILEGAIQWDTLDLLVAALSDFLKEIELTKQKIDPNDWHDIFNLVYVGRGDFYWTKEKQWNKIISSNSLTIKYHFNPN